MTIEPTSESEKDDSPTASKVKPRPGSDEVARTPEEYAFLRAPSEGHDGVDGKSHAHAHAGTERRAVAPRQAHAPADRTALLEPLDYARPSTALGDRRLEIQTPIEPTWKRWLFVAVAVAVCGLHIALTHTYWAPAHWGNNQNAYLSAGKLLATTGTTGFEPSSPFEFVGWMWNMADENSTHAAGGWHYPKYPAGVPLLNAIAYTIGSSVERMQDGDARAADEAGVNWMLKVPPLMVTAATLAIFFITRLLAGSFAGIMAMIMFALLTVVVVLTNNPYSHAADMAFATWGMYALLKWWQRGGWWRGAIGGFLIGYAATIRYTEGLLVLPIIAASLSTIRWPRPRWWAVAWSITSAVIVGSIIWYFVHFADVKEPEISKGILAAIAAGAVLPLVVMMGLMIRDRQIAPFVRAAVPLLFWALPLVVLVTFNLFTVGSLTGYDSTNESTGFTLAELNRKWRWGIDQLYNTGLYFYLPLSLLGMFLAFRWNWRIGLWLVLWYVPTTLLYLSYYWGMNLPVWGFLRFFASVLPAGVIAAAWMMHRAAVAVEAAETGGERSARSDSPMTTQRAVLTALVTIAAAGAVAALMYWQLSPKWAGERFWGYIGLAAAAAALVAATICGAGRGVAAPIAIGIFVAFPTAINVDVSVGAMERDFTIATNLSMVGKQCRMAIPEKSVVFGNSQYLHNYLQFAGNNYKLIGADYLLGGRPVPGIGRGPDGDNPNPIQPSRKKFVDKVYGEMNREARMKEAVRIIDEALANKQQVFIVQESAGAGALKDALAAVPDARLKFETVARWNDPAKFTPAALGSLSTIGRDGWARREAWRWQIVEVKRADAEVKSDAPATAPTTAPSTQPE